MSHTRPTQPPEGSSSPQPSPLGEVGLTQSPSVHQLQLPARGRRLAALALGATGVVYGDIGTSPLYAMKECVSGPHGVLPTHDNVLGLLSLIFWALIMVIVVKYLVFVLRADNDGEGGVLALLALSLPQHSEGSPQPPRRLGRTWLPAAAVVGAALLFGDGLITPAISVLSAIEGLEVATDQFHSFVVPITCGILIALFLMQRKGTGGIGAVFGPLMLGWFLCLGVVGLPWIFARPAVLSAFNPAWGVRFFSEHGFHGFLVLGAVVLVITGGEALYADLGHFGRRAIRLAWFAIVFPALVLNYLGQGALLLARPEAAQNPFFALVEGAWLYPLVALATVATIIASQALISGAYSLTRQAIQLGYAPRMTIVHTSGMTPGQIYIPEVNWLLMLGCVALVLSFQRSTNLAAAYGIAVTGTMAITSVLYFAAVRVRWRWQLLPALSLLLLFLVFDVAFLGANLGKITHGGWFPILVAMMGFVVMTTWQRGRAVLERRVNASSLPFSVFLADLALNPPHRVKGTAVFMTSMRRGTPNVLLHHFKHNKVLHRQVVILTIATDDVPGVPEAERIHHKAFGQGIWAVTAHYGFMESPDMRAVLASCRKLGIPIDENDTSFYLGRETLVEGRHKSMPTWRRLLFSFLSKNSRAATDFFGLPPNRVVEIGTQIEL